MVMLFTYHIIFKLNYSTVMCKFITQLIQPISRDTLIKSCSEANLALCQRVSAKQLSQWKSATLWIRNAFVNITQLYKMKRVKSPNMIHINIIRGTFSVVIQSTVHHYHHRHYSHLIIIIIIIIILIIFMVMVITITATIRAFLSIVMQSSAELPASLS